MESMRSCCASSRQNASSVSSSRSLTSNLDPEQAVLHPNRVAPHRLAGWSSEDFAGRHVELAAVAGAGDGCAVEVPLGKRASLVRAGVAEGVEGVVDLCDRNAVAGHREGSQLALPQLVDGSDGRQLVHQKPSCPVRADQTSLRVGNEGIAWATRSSGTSPTIAIVAAWRKSAISEPVIVAPTMTSRSESITRRVVPTAPRP